jgi:hypothetical protein
MSKQRAIVGGRFSSMEASIQYREYAKECDRLVDEVNAPRHKQLLREMAQAWRNLAHQREKTR